MPAIFISYRRADSGGWAGRLYDHLSMRFGKDLVFQDFDDIKLGTDFLHVIRTSIKASKVVLVLIGPYWLKDFEGRRRLENPKDVLRIEIEEALSGEQTVIPVLVGGACIPSEDELPESLKHLSKRNALEITDSRWNHDVGQLIERLRELVLLGGDRLPLSQIQKELHQKQLRYFDLLSRSAAEALEFSQKTLAYLDHVSPLYPNDSYLQVVRGYFHKNEAMALRTLGRNEEFEKALNEAERVFDTMISERSEDAGAWNGKGSVEALRGNYQQALHFVDRALDINPNYEAAKRDREEILRRL